MAQTIETLLRENLYGVFGEYDDQKRRNNIARLWAKDGMLVDHNSRFDGHSGIDKAMGGKLQAFNGIGKIDWGFGPAGAEAVLTGIAALYTFVDPPKK